jgi:hypothetical protein
MGIPFVATNSPVYTDFTGVSSGKFVDGGHDKKHYDDRANQWYKNTIDMVNNLGEYRKKAKENIKIGAEYDADRNVSVVLETYEKIIGIAKTNVG